MKLLLELLISLSALSNNEIFDMFATLLHFSIVTLILGSTSFPAFAEPIYEFNGKKVGLIAPIDVPIKINLGDVSSAIQIKEETSTTYFNGEQNVERTSSKFYISQELLNPNILMNASGTVDNMEMRLSILRRPSGEMIDFEINLSDEHQQTGEIVGEFIKTTFKAFSINYSKKGFKTGDQIFTNADEIKIPSINATIRGHGIVIGLVYYKNRASILADISESYMQFGNNPKAYIIGWMLIDIQTGLATLGKSQTKMQLSNENASHFVQMEEHSEIIFDNKGRSSQLGSDVEKRLKEVQKLLEKNLITEKEAQLKRQEILNDL